MKAALLLLVFAGSLCRAQEPVTTLTIEQAVARALSSSPSELESAAAQVREAQNKVRAARAATALQAEGDVYVRAVRIDLRALGIALPQFPLTNPPQYVGVNGPYFLLDPRLSATKTLIDAAARRRVAAGEAGVAAASDREKEAREQIAADTSRAFLLTLRTSQQAASAAEDLALAEHLRGFAEAQSSQQLGSPTALRDARIAENTARARVSAARLTQAQALLRLHYLIGGDFGTALELRDTLPARPPVPTPDEALALALQSNPQLRTLAARGKALKLRDRAVSAEALPSLHASADAGLNGVAPDPSGASGLTHSFVFNAAVQLQVPLLDGHRRELEHLGIASESRQLESQRRDLLRSLELRVRLAAAALAQGTEQLDLARSTLAEQQSALVEAEAAHTAGTGSGLDLDRARTARAAAADAVEAAGYAQRLARLNLAEATGTVASLTW